MEHFNPDPTKQAQEVIFSCETKKLPHPPLVVNNANVNKYIKAPKHHTRLLS